jgi:hypothetical protein
MGSPGTIGAAAAPTVTVTATDSNASEVTGDPATFRFARTGSTLSALTLNYTLATGVGRASSNDYTPALTGAVTIPAGQSFVNVTLTPVVDSVLEGTETVALTLGDTGSYDVGSPASAIIAIADNPAAVGPAVPALPLAWRVLCMLGVAVIGWRAVSRRAGVQWT